ncbi:glycosyltransferase family 4 protein [Bacillus horti]|uniref:Glycosyltransferase involved in cell wall biosynthesis n=1 Tax=Caldalkalibacillus horti TaxID=77523 RepID=A0ABT9VY22_9BACI|nr:glycosyltransferase family 4 protein [Bacillus horti]MDQ0165784.1 glycosyltransferase involved in cell wall biosynthesis [Bacillus horti]
MKVNKTVWVMSNEYAPQIIGGLGTVTTQLTRALDKEKVKIVVLTSGQSFDQLLEQDQSTPLYRFPYTQAYYNSKKRFFKVDPVVKYMEQSGVNLPTLIHIHSMEFVEIALYYKRKYNCPIVYSCHSLIDRDTKRYSLVLQKKMLRQASCIVVPSIWQKNDLGRRYPFAKKRTKVVRHGVNLVQASSTASHSKLLFVGRVVPNKGVEELIRAISILKKRNRNVQLDIIGKGSVNYMKRLHQIARRYKVSANVNTRGFYPPDQIQTLITQYGAMVMPSKTESFGLVALEAMASQVPLVSTRSGGLKDFVRSTRAQIIPNVNSKSIAKAIQNMWSKPNLTAKRVKHAYNYAQRNSWSQIAKSYMEIFNRLQ